MSRIVDPIFADMRWEDGHLTLRGCIALLKALSLRAVMSLPGWCAAVWADDDHAIPRAAGYVVLGAILVSTLLLIYPTIRVRHVSRWLFLFTSVPQAIAITLPSTIMIAIPMAFRRRHVGPRLLRRTLVLLLLFVGVMYGVLSRVMPEASQTLRGMEVYFRDGRQVTLRREPSETVWAALRREVRDLERMKDAQGVAAMIEYRYQGRVAMVASAVPLGLAGLVICVVEFGRRRPVLSGAVAVVLFWMLNFVFEFLARMLMTGGSVYGVAVCAWTPSAILLIAASTTLRSSRYLIQSMAAGRGV